MAESGKGDLIFQTDFVEVLSRVAIFIGTIFWMYNIV